MHVKHVMTWLIVSAVQCEYRQLTPGLSLPNARPNGRKPGRHTSLSPWEEQQFQNALEKGSLLTLAVLAKAATYY